MTRNRLSGAKAELALRMPKRTPLFSNAAQRRHCALFSAVARRRGWLAPKFRLPNAPQVQTADQWAAAQNPPFLLEEIDRQFLATTRADRAALAVFNEVNARIGFSPLSPAPSLQINQST